MTMRKVILILASFLAIGLLLNLAIGEEGIIEKTNLSGKITLPPKPLPKLTSAISHLYRTYRERGLLPALRTAEAEGIKTSYDTVQVVIEGESKRNISSISSKMEELGGRIETTYKNLIQARIPISELSRLADSAEVKLIRKPLRAFPQKVSEGYGIIGASYWKNVRFRPPQSPVKVAILDLGFKGYKQLLGSELPESPILKSFRSDYDIEAEEEHGAACAEIVYDLAPECTFYLVNFSTDVENHQAVQYLVSQGVDIISYSIGWFNAGAGDGTGPICEDVDYAHEHGVVWVSAAGNEAEEHWEGTFTDPDNDGWTSFVPGDETLTIYAGVGTEVDIFLNWDDWYNSNQDYDLYLMDENMNIVASSENPQDGNGWPTEEIYYVPPKTGYYHIGIKKYKATRNVKLEIFVWNAWMEYTVASGSLTIPADSPNAIAVGATYWADDSLEYYSSWGPTSDGRIKPDFCAPTGVSTASYGYQGFYGTSAATPHVAGAIALIKSRIGLFSFDDIYKLLIARAIDYGDPGKDNKYGYGRINIGPPTE